MKSFRKRSSGPGAAEGADGGIVMESSPCPMQNVPKDRPAAGSVLSSLPQNPVAIQPIDGAVPPLQLDPVVDERGPARVASRTLIRKRHFHRIGLRDDDWSRSVIAHR